MDAIRFPEVSSDRRTGLPVRQEVTEQREGVREGSVGANRSETPRASGSVRPGLSVQHSPLPCSPAFRHGPGGTCWSPVAALQPEQRLSRGRGLAGAINSVGASRS